MRALVILLACALHACAAAPEPPPIVVGPITLTRADDGSGSFVLAVGVSNYGSAPLRSFTISATAATDGGSAIETMRTPLAVRFSTPVDPEHSLTCTARFRSPFAVMPRTALTLEGIVIDSVETEPARAWAPLVFPWSVDES